MTNLERSCFFNDCGPLDIFPNQIAFTRKVQSGNIKFIQNLSPFGIADFAESAALQGARSTVAKRLILFKVTGKENFDHPA